MTTYLRSASPTHTNDSDEEPDTQSWHDHQGIKVPFWTVHLSSTITTTPTNPTDAVQPTSIPQIRDQFARSTKIVMCYTVHQHVVFQCRAHREHLVTYHYLPGSGPKCISKWRDDKGKRRENTIKGKPSCKKKFREISVEKTSMLSFPPKWCPHKSCGGRGMPGQIQKHKHEKTDWKKVVRIDMDKSEDRRVWADAFAKVGHFSDDGQSGTSVSNYSDYKSSVADESSAYNASKDSEASESTGGSETVAESCSGDRTPRGRHSPASLTESEASYVETQRHEKLKNEQRRIARGDVAWSDKHHSAQRPLPSRGREPIEWPDANVISSALAQDSAALWPDGFRSADKGKRKLPEFELDIGKGYNCDAAGFMERFDEHRGHQGGRDLHAVAQQGSASDSDASEFASQASIAFGLSDSQAGTSIALSGLDADPFEAQYETFKVERARLAPYLLLQQRMTAERFAVAWASDWPEEPVEQHIQSPLLLSQISDPHSSLSRILYATAVEARVYSDASGSARGTQSRLSVIDEESDEDDTVRDNYDSRAARRLQSWLDNVSGPRPQLDHAMRRIFAECRSHAERRELVFLLKITGSEGMALECVTRALCDPGFSRFAGPAGKGERGLIELTDPAGREERRERMRDAQLAGRMGERSVEWHERPKDEEGREFWWTS